MTLSTWELETIKNEVAEAGRALDEVVGLLRGLRG